MGVIIPYMFGGLGNWLFQLANALRIAECIGFGVYIGPKYCNGTPHSDIDYFSTILRKVYTPSESAPDHNAVFNEPREGEFVDPTMFAQKKNSDVVLFKGYFQHWQNVSSSLAGMLTFDNTSTLLSRHRVIRHTCFIHIRGGDYLRPGSREVHHVPLDKYYERAIRHMMELGIVNFSIFTNDLAYCRQRPFLTIPGINYTIVEENEIDSLYLMTQCKAGITANSTFSWWGAFLNRDRPLCLPSKWFVNPAKIAGGLYFPGATVIPV
jgi:hypothetical protein